MPYVTSWERMAKQRGIDEGKREGILAAAVEFLKNGISLDMVIKSTGFTKEEIQKAMAKASVGDIKENNMALN